jgi:hypothetical protein
LQFFFDRGIMTGNHPNNWNAAEVPRFSAISDSSATLERRARAGYPPPFYYQKTNDRLANPMHLDSLFITPALVVPSYPNKSVLLFRQRSRNTMDTGLYKYDSDINPMPPLGSYEVNEPATKLIAQWITEMAALDQTPVVAIRKNNPRTSLKSPIIDGRRLYLPAELTKYEWEKYS